MDLSYIPDRYYRLYLLFAYTRDEMRRVRTRELANYGIRPAQSSILMALKRLGDQATPAALSRLIPRDSQSICGILNRMEKQGLVKRVKDPGNSKRTRITSTERGKQTFLLSMKHESIHNMFASLSQEEQLQLESLLLKLYEVSIKEKDGQKKNRPTKRDP
jgi:DNA-binding MarR family transcriptional regulator